MIFIPTNVNPRSNIIVEGTNIPRAALISDFEKDSLLKTIKDIEDYFYYSSPIKSINEKTVNYPYIYPLFPRVVYKNKCYYNHMLSSNSMFNKEDEKTLKALGIYRTDLQLIEMINDAKRRMISYGLEIDDKVIMYGFSASAKFANRFTLLHPELVKYTIAGAIGGTITLPVKEYNGEKLLWPVGIGNIEEVSDEKLEIYKEVPQVYFQGMLDKNDSYQPNEKGTCKYKDILQDDEAIQMYKILGKNMNGDRFEKTLQIIKKLNFNINIKACDGGHSPNIMTETIEEIFRNLDKSKQL